MVFLQGAQAGLGLCFAEPKGLRSLWVALANFSQDAKKEMNFTHGRKGPEDRKGGRGEIAHLEKMFLFPTTGAKESISTGKDNTAGGEGQVYYLLTQ